jgi:hypothetical protein
MVNLGLELDLGREKPKITLLTSLNTLESIGSKVDLPSAVRSLIGFHQY